MIGLRRSTWCISIKSTQQIFTLVVFIGSLPRGSLCKYIFRRALLLLFYLFLTYSFTAFQESCVQKIICCWSCSINIYWNMSSVWLNIYNTQCVQGALAQKMKAKFWREYDGWASEIHLLSHFIPSLFPPAFLLERNLKYLYFGQNTYFW